MAIVVPIVAKFVDEGIDKAKSALSETERQTSKTAAVFKSLAAPAAAATTAMIGAGYAAAKNAGGAAKANKKLAASFAAVGYPENAAAAMKYADSLQHVIGVSDEEIQATMQKLAAFKDVSKSQDMMARATLAAANMSAAGFGTMESAATALGKAITNPVKGINLLERSGVQFTQQQHEQIKAMVEVGDTAAAQAIIMKQVEGTFSGVAEASASGTEKMKLQWDEAAESLGTGLLPILSAVIAILSKLGSWMGKNTKLVMTLVVAFTALTASITVVGYALKAYQTASAAVHVIQKLTTQGTILHTVATKAQTIAMNIASFAARKLGVSMLMALGVIGLIIAAVVVLAIVIIKNWDKIKAVTAKVWGWITGFLKATWEKIKGWCKAAFDAIAKIVSKAWDILKRIIRLNPFIFILTHLDWIKAKMSAAWEWISGKVKGYWDKIKGLFKTNPFTAIQGFLDQLKSWFTSTFEWIIGKVNDFVNKVKSAVDSVKGMVGKAKDMASKIPRPGKGKSAPGGSNAVVARAFATPVTQSLVGGVPVPQTGLVPVRPGDAGPTINVYGALDPDAVGRQIKRILENHDTRQGRARGAPRQVAW